MDVHPTQNGMKIGIDPYPCFGLWDFEDPDFAHEFFFVQASSGDWTPDCFKYLEAKWELQPLGLRREEEKRYPLVI